MQIFDQTHGLTPSENCRFCHLLNSMFLSSRKANFLSKKVIKDFLGLFDLTNSKFFKKMANFCQEIANFAPF